ncbi:hypothetical protein [Mycolicibacterium sp. A43C]
MVGVLGVVAITAPPNAAAQPDSPLALAITASRAAAQCAPLRYDPQVEHAAQIINDSTRAYIDHTAESIPIDDVHPLALTRDLGISGDAVYSLKGSGYSEGNAIKGLVVQGFKEIPNCAYDRFGVDVRDEPNSGYSLAIALLVGP